MSMKGIMSANVLATYIEDKYNDYTNGEKTITPIKMQKALYFCFAFWGGFISKGKEDNDEFIKKENDILFSDTIEAWSYGPVVPSVYFHRTKDSEKEKEREKINDIFKDNAFLKETIDSILDDVFKTSDFKLVSISHMDTSWQRHFHDEAEKHNEEIPRDEIIREYARRKFA